MALWWWLYDKPKKAWYSRAWAHRRSITIPAGTVGADLTNYPLLVKITNDANLLAYTQSAGQDLLFTAGNKRTKLDHEILSFGNEYTVVNSNGAYCWFGNPHAIHYAGVNDHTYLGWVDNSGNVRIGGYDHTAGAYLTPYTLHATLQYDDHDEPGILIRASDQKLLCFYSAHQGGQMYMRVSSSAEDISAFAAEVTLSHPAGDTNFSYASPIQLDGEVDDPIYLFYRGLHAGSTGLALCYRKSTDGGATWAEKTEIFANGDQRPYWLVAQNGTNRIDFVVTDGHPNEVASNSVYHFYYQGGNYYKSDGTQIVAALPLGPADVSTVYADPGTAKAWVWDIAIDGAGSPVVAFAKFVQVYDHRYEYATLAAGVWTVQEIVASGCHIDSGGPESAPEYYYSGGISLNHDDPATCYLSRQVGGIFEVYRYSTADGGATWTPTAITSSSHTNNIRPVVPRNAHAGLPVLWMNGTYTHYDSFATQLCSPGVSGKTLLAYVRVPSLAAATPTRLYLYYGNAAAADQQNVAGVWLAYVFVVHGQDDPASATNILERAAGKNGTKPGANLPTRAPGFVSGAQYFYRSISDSIDFSTQLNMAGWTGMTLEFLLNRVNTGASIVPISNWDGANNKAEMMCRLTDAGAVQFYVIASGGTVSSAGFAGLTVAVRTWKRLAFRYANASGLEAFLDKVKSATNPAGNGNLHATASPQLLAGTSPHDLPAYEVMGYVEEIRIASSVLSDAWLNATYDNLSAPTTFSTVGVQESRA